MRIDHLLNYLDHTIRQLRVANNAKDLVRLRMLAEEFAQLSIGFAECISPAPRTMTALESDEACVSSGPLCPEADVAWRIIQNGLAHSLAIVLFNRWLKTAEVIGLTVPEIRGRFEEDHPARYLPKSKIRELLIAAGYRIDKHDCPYR